MAFQPRQDMTRDITKISHRTLEDPHLHIALYQPEIPANTGNIARLCGAAEIRLHLIHPLGFRVDDKHLKRAGLDYWHDVDVRHHENFESFLKDTACKGKLLVLTRHTQRAYTTAKVTYGDYLLFGRETTGLPAHIRKSYPCYSIPILGKVRSLNLSTAAGIVAYHFLHQMGRF